MSSSMAAAHSARTETPITVLTVPGLGGSGPEHWQTRWERERTDTRRVELGNWDAPDRAQWVRRLDAAIWATQRPLILVAHSLGCQTVARWASGQAVQTSAVRAALLVAPADVDDAAAPREISSFAPRPRTRLPFPTILVASSNDPWCSENSAKAMAAEWGSDFVPIGALGHINADSGLGSWPNGKRILDRLVSRAKGEGHRPEADL